MIQNRDPGDENPQKPFEEMTEAEKWATCGIYKSPAPRSEGLPELCYTPMECTGRTACPRHPSCSS